MSTLIVVDRPENWHLDVPGVDVASAQDYLTLPKYSELRRARVFNLCRSYVYQTVGYYVSLLAAARGHVPRPSVSTIREMSSRTIFNFLGTDLDALIQKSLARIQGDYFELSIYFGRNTARAHDRLALRLYNIFEAPLMRAGLHRRGDRWQLTSVRPIATNDIPQAHRALVEQFAREYFAGRLPSRRREHVARYDLAILYSKEETEPPSNEKALANFVKAAGELGIRAELITKDDFGRLAEFDALFLRETTAVEHHTYRFARAGVQLGLVVIDDPESILRCSNKVFQAESFVRRGIRAPRTRILHQGNCDEVLADLGLPCVLKQPDSAFSKGVIKVDTPEAYAQATLAFLEDSDLAIAQEFLRTDFDWRIGVFEGVPLYACKYHMAKTHWQIMNWNSKRNRYGNVDALPVEEAPPVVVKAAVKAAATIGDGLYGVDVKHIGDKAYIVEVNDNPSIEAGIEDSHLGFALYQRIMQGFLRRIECRARGDLRA